MAALAAASLATAIMLWPAPAAAALPGGTGAGAAPGRIAVGLLEGAPPAAEVAARAELLTGGRADRTLEPLGAFVVAVPDVEAAMPVLRSIPGVEYVEPVERSRSLSFLPTDPLIGLQWYLSPINAFDFWETPPAGLETVRVAVVDSGVQATHPDLAGRIAATRSFVSDPATQDDFGHGTLVAGEIAAEADNRIGVAGLGLPVQLLIARVVDRDGRISTEAEAKAIRWAVTAGAKVINLSLGGRRDPRNPALDQYSALEQDAVEYAFANGAVIVAATGNCPGTPCPYPYASYPAALPHVVGVSAMTQDAVPATFSNRDPVFNDLTAPGTGIVSTFPEPLTDPKCPYPGYSLCALAAYRTGDGTSFSTPLVSATAALMLSLRPSLTASQVMKVLQTAAIDVGTPGRDAATGAGLLNVQEALRQVTSVPLPPPDAFELSDDGSRTNGDAGKAAHSLYGTRPKIRATVDAFDDPVDVYRVYLRAGRQVKAAITGPEGTKPTLALWRPGTKHVTAITRVALSYGNLLAFSTGANAVVRYGVPTTGWYFVEVKAPKRAGGSYRLVITK